MGAHQKIDRIARKQLIKMTPASAQFPRIKDVLHFEGMNGPDGIKVKSPGVNEPWHYVDPFNDEDEALNSLLRDHYANLVKALKRSDTVKASFEAAWLAHALVDGLTPAHHFPYEKELEKLREGADLGSRTNFRKKLIMPGETKRKKLSNNWKMWGAGGLYATHVAFELGVATIIAPLTFKESLPNESDMKKIRSSTVVDLFNKTAREVAVLDMFHNYMDKGWTPKLAWQVRHRLGPALIRTVSLTWYKAMYDAGLVEK